MNSRGPFSFSGLRRQVFFLKQEVISGHQCLTRFKAQKWIPDPRVTCHACSTSDHGDESRDGRSRRASSFSKWILSFSKEDDLAYIYARKIWPNKYASQFPKCYGMYGVVNVAPDIGLLGLMSRFHGQWNSKPHLLYIQRTVYRYQYIRGFASKGSKSGKGKKKQKALEDTDESDDEDISQRDMDDLDRDWDPAIDDQRVEEEEISKDWKDIQQHVPSLRLDAVLSAGLGVSRKKIEEAYLSMRLRVNGEKVTKKSKQVKEGDILDLILERSTPSQAKEGEVDSEGMSVMRIHIKEISTDRTGKDRIPLLLRRWKNLTVAKKK